MQDLKDPNSTSFTEWTKPDSLCVSKVLMELERSKDG